jgi:beta-mannanase
VAAGDDDAIIIRRAKAIKAFGKPIMIRWFWEMNLDDTNNAPRTQCYDRSSDLPGGYFAPGPYLKAWAHIRAVFASQGVTNVVWLWCVANAHGGPAQYYPGDSEVDWVGMDDYDTNDVSLNDTFYILAEELSQFQEKPFMITETGAHASNQVSFLTGAANVLQTNYPWARAVGYLDSTGNFQAWTLSQAGLSAFKTFAQAPYMSAMEASAPIR